ncbi:flagellar export chaperone FliS [Glutamicibacter sp. MCAF14]|uniref:flagellar export chaperone FliS n=1 Tax=Glutamicibacter sp. MCAF14 TaxID=3233043 RepID=UPI003F90168D
MTNPSRKLAQLNREAILSASPAKLLTMLYDRLLLDLNRARTALQEENWSEARENLIHAQSIIAELAASLDDTKWSGAPGQRGIYAFATQLLIDANTKRDTQLASQCIALLDPLREAWHLAASAPAAAGIAERGVNVG